MPRTKLKIQAPISESKQKELREHFGNYENAVTLISSLQAWFEYRWGQHGKQGRHLLRFDRFPQLGQLTPDFLVHFKTPYILCGEHVKTFRTTRMASSDVDQIMAYAKYNPSDTEGKTPKYDVVVLVPPEADDTAADEIASARAKLPTGHAVAPVVVISQYLDRTTNTGEWFKLKWRNGASNQRFSNPNVSATDRTEDLNKLISDKQYCPIRVTYPALDFSGQLPLINDRPPPLYTAVRLVLPALNSLLSEEERDTLQATGRVEKTFTRDDIINAPVLGSVRRHPRIESIIKGAIDFLCSDVKCLKVIGRTVPQTYSIALDRKTLKDPLTVWITKSARVYSKSRSKGKSGIGRRSKDSPGQQRFAFGD